MRDTADSIELEGQLPVSPAVKLSATGRVLGCLGGFLLICMMLLTVSDVVGRYIFNAPIKGASELTEILLCAVIFVGLCAVSLAEDHVVVDLITEKMPESTKVVREALTGLLGGVILLVISWRIWIYSAQIAGYGGSTINLSIPVAPLGYFCAICAFVGGLITAFLPLKRVFTIAKD